MGSTTGSIIITVKGKEVYVGTAPPSSPVDNELWLDISENNVLKYYKASTKTWCVVNDVSEKFGDVYKYLQTNYYTKTETNSAVKEEIGKTTIIKKDGTVVNMKDAINSVIDTATEHTQKIEDINSKYNSVTGEITEVKTSTSEIKQDLNGFKTTVSENYVDKTEFNNLQIGGTNLIRRDYYLASNSGLTIKYGENGWVNVTGTFTGSTGNISICDVTRITVTPNEYVLSVERASGENLAVNISIYSNGSWKRNATIPTSESSVVITIAENETLGYLSISVINGTTYNLKYRFKLERGNKATDWSPAPEDIETEITSVETIATQTANKFNWLVKSGTSATDFTLTNRTATLVSDYINLKGLVTFSGLNSDAQNKINTANTTANSANTKAQGIIDNIYTPNTTTIDGGKITTGSIKASSIDVNNLFAQNITATGSITSPLLQSDDYKYTEATIEGEEYSDSGMIVDLRNKIIRTPKFCLKKDGTMFASEIHGGRYYGSTSSEMAFIFHGFTGGNKGEADLLKVHGNSADGSSYATYIDTDNDTFDFMKPCHFSYGMSSGGIDSYGDITSTGDIIAGVGTSNQVSVQGLKDELMGSGNAYTNGWEDGARTLKASTNIMIYAFNILKSGVYMFIPSFRTIVPSGHIFSVGLFEYTKLQYPVAQYKDACTMVGTGKKHSMNGVQIFNAKAGKRYYIMGYSTATITLDALTWYNVYCLKTT